MKTRTGTLAVLATALACAPAQAAPTKVNVRVEGATHTLFEGSVVTDAHEVTGDDGTRHKCDGTNGGANAVPGPTATGALDTAAQRANLTLDAHWDQSFQDFIVNRIGPDAATSSKFWGVAVNGQELQVGGCQFEVHRRDQVLWAYDMFSKKHLLVLSGPHRARTRKTFRVRVVDGQDGKPVAHARVAGRRTNRRGIARLRFRKPGVKRLKARRHDSVRSNQLRVRVVRARAAFTG